jgi:hypothetical protein
MDAPADLDGVLAANRRYYEVFESADLDGMSSLWEHSERAVCTHPGWATLRGWPRVSSSYFALFQQGSMLQFVLTEERPVVAGDTAWVSVDENLLGESGGITVATLNVFVRHPEGWYLVAHHGSVVHGLDDDG